MAKLNKGDTNRQLTNRKRKRTHEQEAASKFKNTKDKYNKGRCKKLVIRSYNQKRDFGPGQVEYATEEDFKNPLTACFAYSPKFMLRMYWNF